VRGLGIGQIMLSRLARLAEEPIVSAFLSGPYSIGMSRRLSFYQKLGAKPLDTWIIYRLVGMR